MIDWFLDDVQLVIFFGLLPLGITVWCWLGRGWGSRWWVGDRLWERWVLWVMPAGGLLVCNANLRLVPLGQPLAEVRDAATVWMAIGLGLAIFWGVVPLLPIPRWWGPRWFRDMTPEERRPEFISAVAVLGTMAKGTAGQTGVADTVPPFQDSPILGDWSVAYIYDTKTTKRAHAMAVRGGVAGKLTAHDAGLAFASSKLEDSIHGKPIVVAVSRGDLKAVRIVPARADANGVRAKGFFLRSPYPRLVIDTDQGAYVFEILRAKKAAEALNGFYRLS